jgi:hypothetical protein
VIQQPPTRLRNQAARNRAAACSTPPEIRGQLFCTTLSIFASTRCTASSVRFRRAAASALARGFGLLIKTSSRSRAPPRVVGWRCSAVRITRSRSLSTLLFASGVLRVGALRAYSCLKVMLHL